MLVGDFCGAVFVDGVVVAGDHRLVVAKPDLLLAPVALTFAGLDSQTRALHTQPDIAQQRFHPRRAQYRVVVPSRDRSLRYQALVRKMISVANCAVDSCALRRPGRSTTRDSA